MCIILRSVGYTVILVSANLFLFASEARAKGKVTFDGGADPQALYGAGIDFDVYRKGEKVGYHRVRFHRDSKDLIVSSRFQLEISFLYFTAFEYLYEAEGRWRDGQLLHLEAAVNDNGTQLSLAAERSGDRIVVRNADGTFTERAPM